MAHDISDATGNNSNMPTAAMAEMQLANRDYRKQIEELQQQLSESHVKHGEEVYWLRLELDSSRREKESVEDRMAELYRGIQELLTSNLHDDEDEDDLCTEPEYVRALKERVTAYERSVDILNRQIEMLKASSSVVMTSMKQEVSDLVEEKSHMERDLLNQISNLDTAKRDLERQLEATRRDDSFFRTVANDVSRESASTQPAEQGAEPTDSNNNMSFQKTEISPVTPIKENVNEESYRSTDTTTQGSSFYFTQDVTPSAPLLVAGSADDVKNPEQSILVESLCEEVKKWKEEAKALEATNSSLQSKMEEITKELMFTKSSANMALALDRIEMDRTETLTHLDRIKTLWDRADSTIQITEGLMAQFQAQKGLPESNPSNQVDRERILSTLETASLVHGQIKMSLMLIELTFRNHLACIQNDNLQELQNVHVSDKLEQVRKDTLNDIANAETKWGMAVEQVERQILAENQSTNESLKMQLEELQRAQDRQRVLERELATLKSQPTPLAAREDGRVGDASQSAGLVVSREMMMRLQQEIVSVVTTIEEKNEAIQDLMATIDQYRLREDVMKKELKRVQLKQAQKSSAKPTNTNSGTTRRFKKLELPSSRMDTAARGQTRKIVIRGPKEGRKSGSRTSDAHAAFPSSDVFASNNPFAVLPQSPHPNTNATSSSPSSLEVAHSTEDSFGGFNPGWSTL